MKTIRPSIIAAMLATGLTGCANPREQAAGTLRIGYQKWGTFSILKSSGKLAEAFRPKGMRVEWTEFPAGPPLLEAMNAGSIDLGHSGDSPPLFAQAVAIPFVYFAVSSASPESSAILVKSESNIRNARDLRGRRVGFAKGTSAHPMVLRYLEKNGLSLSDITAVYLSPADGRVALEAASIDAWSIWDPYLAAAQQAGGYRVLTTGKGFVDGREFYMTSRALAERRPQLIRDSLVELERMKAWAKANSKDVDQFLASDTGIPISAVALAESRRNRYGTLPITADLIASQQSLADRYLELGLLPKKIDVKANVWDLAQAGGK